MTGGGKHANLDELASLSLGALRPRRAAKIEAHVASCELCAEVRQQLDSVPATLASTTYPPMPAYLASRVEVAIGVEARQRLADTPATETSRGLLPARRERRSRERGWRLPGLSVRATRLVAAAGAVVVGVGSYAAVSNLGGQPGGQSSPAAAAPATPDQLSLGPEVTYGQPGSLHTIHAVHSSANFTATDLKTDAVEAVDAAKARGASPARASLAQPQYGSAAPAPAGPDSQLSGCLSALAPDRIILLVDVAKYDGKAATIVVAAAMALSPAEVWVVGSLCSATNPDVLTRAALGHV